MRVELGSEVRTTDGQVVGRIKHLIMEPENVNVRAVVIEKGLLLPDDVEVDLSRLNYGIDQRIELNCTKEEYDRLPRFDRSKYTDRPPTNLVLAGFPPVGVLWNVPSAYPMSYSETGPIPAPTDTSIGGTPDSAAGSAYPAHSTPVVIEKGSGVYSSDDHQIGEVHEVTFDVSTGRPILLVIRSGLIVHSDTQIPAELIREVGDGEVRLNVTLDQFKQMYAHPLRPAA
jgi:sporulation protein YlmC with PRC-barrel domain